ncbi:MAG: ATP-binding protein [Deltaproteobacteria bacterium]|nr:ATP-binding protein [Deltaproteobacteria bacterium]
MYNRLLSVNKMLDRSFFLWGPRQSGKTTFLREHFPDAHWINLLYSDQLMKYQAEPYMLRRELKQLRKRPDWVIIDEVQKVPSLLNEVHALIEEEGIRFGLCGSSARKVRHGHANLLGGRALKFLLYGLSASEIGKDVSLTRLLQHGYLPTFYDENMLGPVHAAYAGDYLKEEVAAEGLIRNLPAFSNFLKLASLSDTEILNYSTFARDVGVSSQTIKEYYEILVDTLIGSFLPSYQRKKKRRVRGAPKFYFFDVGIVNYLSNRGLPLPRSPMFGKAFENWVMHELQCYKAYRNEIMELHYWALSSGIEVDFILGDMEVAIEAKAAEKVTSDHCKGLVEIAKDYNLRRRILVCMVSTSYRRDDGIEVCSWSDFLAELWSDQLL